jgi:HlyD family secretion protein
MKPILFIFLILLITLTGCSSDIKYDASGSFEAVETIISSQTVGTIKSFNIEEGENLLEGQTIGYIDTLQLYLKKKNLEAQIKSILSQKPEISTQLASFNEQLQSAEKDQKRFIDLVKEKTATQKQLDDINLQVAELKRNIEAQKSSLTIATNFIEKQTTPLKVQIEEINEQIKESLIINPVNGTVLTKYVEQDEMATEGKPLYKIADLSSIILRAYVTGSQLPQIKLNKIVKIYVDNGAEKYKEYSGQIEWISDISEFTPKNILTKTERANLVYAVKIKVKNDDFLKIGMFGEVKL